MSYSPEVQAVLAVCAVVGALLGVVNLVRSYLTDSERVRVAYLLGDKDGNPRVEVVNVSPFPITVTAIGRLHNDGQVSTVAFQVTSLQDALPYRIEARHSRAFNVTLREVIADQIHKVRYTFVLTALGNRFTSERRAHRWIRRLKEGLRLKDKDL